MKGAGLLLLLACLSCACAGAGHRDEGLDERSLIEQEMSAPKPPPEAEAEEGCKPLLRYLTLEEPDQRTRHSCWNRVWEVPAALVAYPVVCVVLVGAISSPIWVPIILLK